MKDNKITQDKILEIAKFLQNNFKNIVITSEDSKQAQEISQKTNIKYLKTTSLDDMADYLQCAKFILTLEGGAMHLAPALGVQTFTIFGKSNAKRWVPIYGRGKCILLQDKSRKAENVANELIFEVLQKELG